MNAPAASLLGDAGERLAAKHIKRNGGRVVARNWRCKMGEVDLVALDDGVLAFVEVKSKSTTDRGEPSEAVHYGKRRKLEVLARQYCCDKRVDDTPVRFDIVEIVWSKPPQINWIRGAWLEGE